MNWTEFNECEATRLGLLTLIPVGFMLTPTGFTLSTAEGDRQHLSVNLPCIHLHLSSTVIRHDAGKSISTPPINHTSVYFHAMPQECSEPNTG